MGLPEQKGAVEEIQGLQRVGGAGSPGSCLASIRAIKRPKGRVLLLSRLRLVNHSPPLGRAELLLGDINPYVVVVGLKDAVAWTAHPQIEVAAQPEDRIADGFGLEPPGGKSPQEARACIFFHSLGPRLASLTIRAREEDHPVNGFEAPAGRRQLACQP